jgi:hypothetical protein
MSDTFLDVWRHIGEQRAERECICFGCGADVSVGYYCDECCPTPTDDEYDEDFEYDLMREDQAIERAARGA